MPFQERRTSTRIEIIRLAAMLFTIDGFTATSMTAIARKLKISPGNITFYFPTKEHLLSVLAGELCEFQKQLMEREIGDGYSDLFSYCLELTCIAAACEEDEVAKDFFHAMYSHPMTLEIIRENDTAKTEEIFKSFQPDWTKEKWVEAENLVSGIEYATITAAEAKLPLQGRIGGGLDLILTVYGVPEQTRRQTVGAVLEMDYRAMGKKILAEFREFVQSTNDEALKEAKRKHSRNPWRDKS